MSLERIADPDQRVVFFPVRHHSPAAARLVRQLIRMRRPAAVLIEGPWDFNSQMPELLRPHQLPVALYSFFRLQDGTRRGAFYPFCVYSPEGQALQAAVEAGAETRFIDLPWADLADQDEPSHRYADAALRRGLYIRNLCRQLGLDDFDALWDALFEADPALDLRDYLRRMQHLCYHERVLAAHVPVNDRRREAFMASEIRSALDRHSGPVLVVTGGYHSYALFARLHGEPFPGTEDPADCQPSLPQPGEERGIALTPYSYQRLDSLTGYDSGMPSPGFYHQAWLDREAPSISAMPTYLQLLAQVTQDLRQRKQAVSTADLIAVQTAAEALAALRGRTQPWRLDLLDAVTGALVKDELEYGANHPFLDAVHRVLRGHLQGKLAEGTARPPLVLDIHHQLQQNRIVPQLQPKQLDLDLLVPADRQRSRLLHQLRILRFPGFERIAGTDWLRDEERQQFHETWRIRWTPEAEGTAIESARYGGTLEEAAQQRLLEEAGHHERDAPKAARLVLDAALAGLQQLRTEFQEALAGLIRRDADFVATASVLGHLLLLFRFDEALQTAGRQEVGDLVREAFERSAWLLESLGQMDQASQLLQGVTSLVQTMERCGTDLQLDRDELRALFARVQADPAQMPLTRGAAVGAAWRLGDQQADRVLAALRLFSDPVRLGDFLGGLFALARESVQSQPTLVRAIDETVRGYSDEQFLTALPALRLAFTYFTPREKHHLALTLLEACGLKPRPELVPLQVSPEAAVRALQLETRLTAALQRYGLRGDRA